MTQRDRAGRTPLHYAVTDGPHSAEYFALSDPKLKADRLREHLVANTRNHLADPGIDVNAHDDEGMTALHFAARNEFPEPAKLLIDAGANVNAVSTNGTTPLYVTVRNTHPAGITISRALLTEGADPTVEMFNGSSALKLAKRAGRVDFLDAFGEYGYR